MENMRKVKTTLEEFSIHFLIVTFATAQVSLGGMKLVESNETAWLPNEKVSKNRNRQETHNIETQFLYS